MRTPLRQRAKVLHVEFVRADGTRRHEIALVDVCVNTVGEIGSRAVWKTDTLRELYCTFAEPDAIGLSSIPGRILPTGRCRAERCRRPVRPRIVIHTVLAPIAPGLLEPVGLQRLRGPAARGDETRPAHMGHRRPRRRTRTEFGPGDRIAVTLRTDGPRVIDVPAMLADEHASSANLLISSIAEEIR